MASNILVYTSTTLKVKRQKYEILFLILLEMREPNTLNITIFNKVIQF